MSISGRVVDAASKPVAGAFVQAIVRASVAGREHNFGGPYAKTDADGRYEITGLSAQSYFVMLLSTQHTRSDTMPAGRVLPPLFFPNATRISGATRVILADGRARTDIDFTQQPVVTQKVSGRLVGSPESYAGLVLRLMADDLTDIGTSADVATTLVNSDGTFTFLNVPHGDYVLIANRFRVDYTYAQTFNPPLKLPATPGLKIAASGSPMSLPSPSATELGFNATMMQGPPYSARFNVAVRDKDIAGFTLEPQELGSLRMRFALEPGGPSPRSMRITLEPIRPDEIDPFVFHASEKGDREFVIDGIPPGEYVLSSSAVFQSLTVDGDDALGRPIKIIAGTSPSIVATYARDLARVSAVIRNDKNELAPGAQLLVYSVDENLWTDFGYRPQWIHATKANAEGKASSSLLPGDYYIAAVPADRVLSWPDVNLLRLAKSQATRMTIDAGHPVTLDVKVISVIR